MTNAPGSVLSPHRVCLVMNPALATNQNYLDKVTALVANFPDQQDEWASVQEQPRKRCPTAERLGFANLPGIDPRQVRGGARAGIRTPRRHAGSKVLW